MSATAKPRLRTNGSFSTKTAISAAKSTLVSRKAATSAMGATVIAQIAIQYEPSDIAPPAIPEGT